MLDSQWVAASAAFALGGNPIAPANKLSMRRLLASRCMRRCTLFSLFSDVSGVEPHVGIDVGRIGPWGFADWRCWSYLNPRPDGGGV